MRIPQGLEVRVLSTAQGAGYSPEIYRRIRVLYSAQMSVHKLDTKVYFGQKAFIEKGGKVLVLRDPNSVVGNQKGIDLPGGKYRWGKNLEAELKREVKEETNTEIEVGKPFTVWTYKGLKKRRGRGTHSVVVGFMCKYKSGQVKLSSEHDMYEWVDENTYKKWQDPTQDFKALETYFKLRKGT